MSEHFCGACLFPITDDDAFVCPDCPEYTNAHRCDLHCSACLNPAHAHYEPYGLVRRCQWHGRTCFEQDPSDIGTLADIERARDLPQDSS